MGRPALGLRPIMVRIFADALIRIEKLVKRHRKDELYPKTTSQWIREAVEEKCGRDEKR